MRKSPLFQIALPATLLLAACQPTVPDSGAGVGFQDYNTYLRSAQAAPAPSAPAAVAPAAPAAPVAGPVAGFDPAIAAAAIDRADGVTPAPPASPAPAAVAAAPLDATGTLDPNRPRGNAPAGIQEQSGEMVHNNSGISDEQDFAAVTERETIESDRARIERNRAQYVVVQPGALPQRPGDTGPNIVEYALATTHPPGVQMHTRRSLVRKDPLVACARFTSPDLAQEEFLRSGGPERDRLGLDPDGDGFACDWDPRPFRTALN